MSPLSVSAFHTRATGASKVRSTTSGSSFVTTLGFAAIFLLLVVNFLRLVLALQFLEVAAQPVEALLPVAPIDIDPVGDVLERIGLEPAGPPLRLAAALDQARALEDLEVLGHGREADLEGLGQLQDRSLARGEAREDRPPSGIGEGGKRGAEAVGRHMYLTYRLNTVRRFVKRVERTSAFQPVAGPEDPRHHRERYREKRAGHGEAHSHAHVGQPVEAPAESAHQIDNGIE